VKGGRSGRVTRGDKAGQVLGVVERGVAKLRLGAPEAVPAVLKCVFGPHGCPPFAQASHFTPGQARGDGRHWMLFSSDSN
jgi:hypothetical protein